MKSPPKNVVDSLSPRSQSSVAPEEDWVDLRASYIAAANLLDGYVHESRFLRDDDSPDNRIIWASEGFVSIFGCSVEEYNAAKIWGSFYHQDEQQAAVDRARALRRGEMIEAEMRVTRITGEIRWLYVKNRPVFDPLTGKVIGILGIGQDITQRKEAEQGLLSLERQIVEIAAREQQRIANDLHDGLGQELTGVAMMLRSIAQRHAQQNSGLQESLEETIRLVNRSIHEVRTLARGLAPLEIGYGGLAGALSSLAAHTREISGVDVRFGTSDQLVWQKELSTADNHLYRIASEAVYNALRHSGANYIRITLRAYHGGILLRVRDDGCGMPGHRSSASGMGVRIMQYRARMIDGHLSIRSRLQGGTSVVCHLPRSTVSASVDRQAAPCVAESRHADRELPAVR